MAFEILAKLLEREWVESTGSGAYASSTLCGLNTRRYHGLFVANDGPTEDRWVLLSRLDETLISEQGSCAISSREYLGAVDPEGYRYLEEVSGVLHRTFRYRVAALDCVVEKSILGVRDPEAIVVRYVLHGAPKQVQLQLEPFAAFRSYHALQSNSVRSIESSFGDDILTIQSGQKSIHVATSCPSEFRQNGYWYKNFFYRMEQERGFDSSEDLYRPGTLQLLLSSEMPLHVGVSQTKIPVSDLEQIFDKEIQRRRKLFNPNTDNEILTRLKIAADQFIVRDSSNTTHIVAGYPWFTSWGRDTMIALPGLCLSTGRFGEARALLTSWAERLERGLIPNRLLDVSKAEYNTIDASLWFVIACHRYFNASKDKETIIESLFPAVMDILHWYRQGTDYEIHADTDGLILGGNDQTQLTWMDATVRGYPVTSRSGKAVEINALWINSLMIASEFAELAGQKKISEDLASEADRVRASFENAFWNAQGNYLYDCVRPDGQDGRIRPNQVLALGLPFEVLAADKARSVLAVVERELLTPYGLRTLAPGSPGYRGHYRGGPEDRDASYHQGTVWPWLMGSYVTACLRYGDEALCHRAKNAINQLAENLDAGAVGNISEIFDAEFPFRPKGAVAQAWSVSELLRGYSEISQTRQK
jgi:predicted glycogen debranching enzyme